MKNLLFSLLVICVVNQSIGQNVFIADNNSNPPTGANIFPTIQEAVDAASAGDFIYVQPSPTTYGNAILTKELHLVGIGFDLTKDFPLQSTMTDIYLRNNIDNTSDADNSTITGLDIRYIYLLKSGSAPDFELAGVKIYNNRVDRIFSGCCGNYIESTDLEIYDNDITSYVEFPASTTNLIFRNNLLRNNLRFTANTTNSGIISNNIIYGYIDKNSEGDLFTIQNNNFIGSNGSGYAFDRMKDASISNNIFYGRTPSDLSAGGSTNNDFQRNVFSNNLAYETGNNELPPSGGGVSNSGANNIEGLSPLFINVLVINSWSSDYDFTLQPGSPAINAGTGSTGDIGISGGPYAFTQSNFSLDPTALPTIEILNVSTVINPGDDLDVRIKAKSN